MKKYLLFIAAGFLLLCCIKETEKEASELRITSSGTLSAERQTVSLDVVCDIPWSASLSQCDWCTLTTVEGGVTISASMNESEEQRSATITIKAGKKEITAEVVQDGITSIVKPLSLALTGSTPSRIDVKIKSSWDASVSEGTTWLTLEKEKASGNLVRLKVIPTDANENVGERTSAIIITIGKDKITIPVSQAQTDAIEANADLVSVSGREAEVEIPAAANVDYTVRIPENVKWINTVNTKSLPYKPASIHVGENSGSSVREAVVYLEYGDISRPVTIRQAYMNSIMGKTVPGVYALSGEGYEYNASAHQLSWGKRGGYSLFRLLDPGAKRVISVHGLPQEEILPGQSFDITLSVATAFEPLQTTTQRVTVLDVGNDGLIWLHSSSGTGLILRQKQ